MKINLSKITKNGKAIYLAYDHGLEHGPEEDFNDKDVNPLDIIKLAKSGGFQGLIFHSGIADKYQKEIRKSKIPLIIKLNGKTKIYRGEPFSPLLCSVKDAVKLGAEAVGYTIYIGSKYESKCFEEFAKVEADAHNLGLPVIAWIYPRGKNVKNAVSREMMAYAARTGLELGADIVKMKSNNKIQDLKWAVKSAGRTKIVVSGGKKESEKEYLKEVENVMKSGAIGIAVGRNIWERENPLEIAGKLRKIVFG